MSHTQTAAELVAQIDAHRAAHGITITDAARSAGWSRPDQWSRYTGPTASRSPSLAVALQMAQAVGLRVELVEG